MAMIKGVEVYFLKVDPKKPNARFNKDNPTWECQIRTTSIKQRDEWKALGLPVKLLAKLPPTPEGEEPDEDALPVPVLTEKGEKIYRCNLSKRSLNKKKEPNEPVKVINGHLEDIDPATVGNGSVANIRIFQYEGKDSKTGLPKTQSMLMALQLTKHIVYVPGDRDDEFDTEETETIMPAENEISKEDSPSAAAKTKPVDAKPDDAF